MFKHLLPATCVLLALSYVAGAQAQISARDAKAVPDSFLSGGDSDGFRLWARGVAGVAKQGVREGIAGYDSSSAGAVVGADTALKSCPAVLGASFSYINTDVEGSGISETEVDSYKLSLYGDYDLGGGVIARASVGAAYDDNQSRRFNAGAPGVTAFGDYGAGQYDALLELMGYTQWGYTTLTPYVQARYIHYSPESYSETGAGLNLNIDQDDMDVLELGAGLSAAWVFDANDGSGEGFSPGLHAGVSYDTIADSISTNTSPVGGGATVTTAGPSIARARVNAGASLVWFSGDGWDAKAAYDVGIKSDYFAQAGTLRVSGQF